MQTELMLPHGHPRLAIRSESLRFFISFLVACRHYAARHDVETLLPGVLELRQCFDRLLGRAGQDELAVLLLHWVTGIATSCFPRPTKPPAPTITKETAVSGAMMRSSIFPTRCFCSL